MNADLNQTKAIFAQMASDGLDLSAPRNLKFNELVATRGIDLYDGWDVSVPVSTDGPSADG